ncbi:His-Xaa-Ser system radical SAM maturase HxsB [Pseudomonas congelans]|uniref:His-Xaa-Ser system radical SAM maturase HxsB n=1 Tax=Pseudomonas congelans TaxID=200452 RepID=UPI001F47E846|nr:His-Xaa-Ser system radical SAM maturase HxsB [Pseudomonas congelans]MCF5166341.1 His-Xaa-Ser system radical SAM maturase HxsB [Pseudomonas congelans]
MSTNYAKGELLPFSFHRMDNHSVVAVSAAGDYTFLTQQELATLIESPGKLELKKRAELQSKYFLKGASSFGSSELKRSRIAARKETVLAGQSLHIIVPTLQCEHSCQYCQVSRRLEDVGHSMTPTQIDAACETIFQSQAITLTIEFQGGDPLLRFDLIQRAINLIQTMNLEHKRRIRFVITSTLHQLTAEMCEYLRDNQVYLSTSLDGPAALHNRNRPLPTRDSHERTLAGIELARRIIGPHAVAALMTTTKASLMHPEAIVDEYVKNGFSEIFMRPLSLYGFAKRNIKHLGYTLPEFANFYQRALQRVLEWNAKGTELREGTAALILNKLLSPFDAGYVDLQSPTGSGLAVLVYNYDGYVYPSDEARMLAETGDCSLRLGIIGDSLSELMNSPVMKQLVETSISTQAAGCETCAFNSYCGPDPVGAQAEFGEMRTTALLTEHCKRHKWLFEYFFHKLRTADDDFLDIAYRWAHPTGGSDA